MAMQATHIRFALDLEKVLDIKDRNAYLFGAMYPDTRYFSGVDRELTHDYSVEPKDLLNGSDFEKGCKTHSLYDRLQHEILYSIFQVTKIDSFKSRPWVQVTAAKLLEDIESWKILGDDVRVIESINLNRNPNGERVEDLQEWIDTQAAIYQQEKPEIASYKIVFDTFENRFNGNADAFKQECYDQAEDEYLMKEIRAVYDQVLKKTHEGLTK